jgi:hypothetical protein
MFCASLCSETSTIDDSKASKLVQKRSFLINILFIHSFIDSSIDSSIHPYCTSLTTFSPASPSVFSQLLAVSKRQFNKTPQLTTDNLLAIVRS